jgi:hypothetical protein
MYRLYPNLHCLLSVIEPPSLTIQGEGNGVALWEMTCGCAF